jgi:hypothetical protein
VKVYWLRNGCSLHDFRKLVAKSFGFGGRRDSLSLRGGDPFLLFFCKAIKLAHGGGSLLVLSLFLFCLLGRLALCGNPGYFSLLVRSRARTISFDDGAALGIKGADKDGLIDGHGGIIDGGGFAADVLAGEIDAEGAGGCGFCVVLCVPTPSK